MINIIPVAVSMLLSVTAATSVAAVPLSQNSVLVARQVSFDLTIHDNVT